MGNQICSPGFVILVCIFCHESRQRQLQNDKQRNLENGLREIGNGLDMNQNMAISKSKKRRLNPGFHTIIAKTNGYNCVKYRIQTAFFWMYLW